MKERNGTKMEQPPLQKARGKYESKRVKININFNTETEADLLQAARDMPQFSAWVKEQLKEYMKNNS